MTDDQVGPRKDVKAEHLAKLKDVSLRMHNLLLENQQGLMSWWNMFRNTIEEMDRLTNEIVRPHAKKGKGELLGFGFQLTGCRHLATEFFTPNNRPQVWPEDRDLVAVCSPDPIDET